MRSSRTQNVIICVIMGLLFFFIYHALANRSDLITIYKMRSNDPRLDGLRVEPISNKEKLKDSIDGPVIYTALGNINYEKAEKEIFKQYGLILENKKELIPKLKYESQPKCTNVYSKWLETSKYYNESAAPPRKIPMNRKLNFTMGGYAHLRMGYMDDRSGVKTAKWDMIEEFVNESLDFFKTRKRNYEIVGVAMFHAMKFHGLEGLHGAVVGSLTPWVESFALRNGAKKVTTIEYMKIDIVGTDKVEYIHPLQIANNAENYLGKFDFAASFSSMEHSGLGRYGDVPDPIGDIREMLKVRCLIKEGGLFFFAVPIGPDALYWNLHRIYGRIRLAIMFTGFELLNTFEKDNSNPIKISKEDFGPDALIYSVTRQTVFVLKKI